MPDATYSITRKKGRPGVVSVFVSQTANPETLKTEEVRQTVNVRWVVKEPTKYSRLVRAKAAQEDVGDTTFLFWLRDLPADLRSHVFGANDYVIYQDRRYDFVQSAIEENGLIATARAVVGQPGSQAVTVSASNSIGLADETTQA